MQHPKHDGIIRFMWIGACLAVAIGIGLRPSTTVAGDNPVVLENQQTGTSEWEIQWGESAIDDKTGQIKGYASATSVNKGEDITFHVSVNPAQTFTIDVYRMGWYQGLGGRLMQHIGPLNGVRQPTCPTDPTTGMIECNWTPSYTLTTQTSWTSGVYLAVLSNAQSYKNYVVFVVRDDNRVADFLFQQAVMTYQAYNDYPYDTGKSLYDFNSYGATTVGGYKAAVKVSFDRPYVGDGDCHVWGRCFIAQEFAFIRWLEKSGYDVTYSTDVDLHTNGARLLNYRGLLIAGHDEYWSKEMYDAAVAARDAGVNLGFFSANQNYWQVRLEPSSSGVPNRVVVCYRDAETDPVADPSLKTVKWRDMPLNRPEQTLIGVQYTSIVMANAQGLNAPYVVANSGHWAYAGTGFQDGDRVTGIVGYEADRLYSENPPPDAVSGTYTLLSHSPYTSASNTPNYGNSSIYQAHSGAWVFAAGTIDWGYALDDWGFNVYGVSLSDPRIKQMTANILGQFVASAQDGFTLAASPSTQTVMPGGSTSYDVTITPTGGFTGDVNLTVSGLPGGAVGTFAPNPATSSSTLSVTTNASTPGGTYTLTITGVSDSITRTATATFIVSVPDFTLSASPATRTVPQGGSTSYGVTITPTGGFTGNISLSVSGLPGGAVGTFAPNPATASSTLTVTTDTSTPGGTYTLTITGISGSITRTTTVTFSISSTNITVTSPNTAVSWRVTTKQNITFTHNLGVGQAVNIDVSRDGGSSWSPITTFTTTSATTGTYSWTVSGPPTTQARIRVAWAANALVNDTSDVNFTIINPVITVTAPNTAVSWRAGDIKNITFSHNMGVGQIANIDVSRDGGASWSPVTAFTTTSATSGTYPWVVSGPPTNQARIRVSRAVDPTVTDSSDVNFTILPRVTVTAPNTAVTWGAGSTRNITWTHNLGMGGTVDIDFSPDNGGTWVPIAAGVASSTATSGTYTGPMPMTVTTLGLIRVSPTSDSTLGDVSNVPFTLANPTVTVTAPNTNVTWSNGATKQIKWNHNLGIKESVKIEMARDGVNYTETIATSAINTANTTGTFNWVVTGPSTTTARIRVTWTTNATVTDISNVNFKIQ